MEEKIAFLISKVIFDKKKMKNFLIRRPFVHTKLNWINTSYPSGWEWENFGQQLIG